MSFTPGRPTPRAKPKSPTKKKKWSVPLPRTVAGRRRLTALLILVAAGAAGYLTTCIAYPPPVFGDDHAVPRVVGMPVAAAEKALGERGFKIKVSSESADPEIAAGAVVWQDPPADLVAPQGTTVEVTRSSGPPAVPVPDLTGLELDAALRILAAAGLRAGDIDSVPSSDDPDVVMTTRPGAGTAKAPGSSVDIVVSERAGGVEVPNVVGLRRDEARRQLEAAGFRVGRVARADGRRGPPGTVIEQRPGAGALASRRSRVDLTVTEVN